MEIVIGALIGLVVGGVLAYIALNSGLKAKKASALKEAKNEAEAIKKEKILQAKERFLHLYVCQWSRL